MKGLLSHPNLRLSEHIAQVRLAMEGIWQWHSPALMTEGIKALALKAVDVHDTGKGTQPFQEYIVDPESYRGDRQEKAHSPLSLVLTLLLQEKDAAPALETLMLAAVVSGHHRGMPCLPGKNFIEEAYISKTLDDFAGGKIAKTLKRQIATLDSVSLAKETGVDITGLDLTNNPIRRAKKYLLQKIMPAFHALSLEEQVMFRLRSQLLFSLLLEADKAFLAVLDPQTYLNRKPRYWQVDWIEKKLGPGSNSPVNTLRKKARGEVVRRMAVNSSNSGLYSLTAPTGIGKTLLAATWALTLREKLEKINKVPPKIIVVLPYLSIIDQTAEEYRAILTAGGQEVDGAWFLTSHSLADRRYAEWLEEKTEPFFIDTWRTELVITTYDQFLLSLLDPRVRYQMRFHNLCDALIIMDEVQSLPCRMWQLLQAVLTGLAKVGHSRVLLMSATLPSFVPATFPLLENYRDYFKEFSRYELRLNVQEKTNIKDFCELLNYRLEVWLQKGSRVLITLNTRRSARTIYDYLKECWPQKFSDIPLFFISADVTPKDRLRKITLIKEGKPCIVISTQCIEAGVDIDLDLVIRDFSPWDSIVQIAGRCNREGKSGKWLPVEIVDLTTEQGRRYCEMIYDEVSLAVTRKLLGSLTVIKENEVLALSDQYFAALDKKKDTGLKHLKKFARWQEDLPVRELLRGKEREKYTFLVMAQDPSLREEMIAANEVDDRWERREAWRKLAGRIAAIAVDIYARPGFQPEEIATEFLGHWILKEGYYDSDCGLKISSREVQSETSSTLVF